MEWLKIVFLSIILLIIVKYSTEERPVWTWKCINSRCEKIELKKKDRPQSLEVCNFRCDPYASLWPRPTGKIKISRALIAIQPKCSVEYVRNILLEDELRYLILKTIQLFQTQLERETHIRNFKNNSFSGYSLLVKLDIIDHNTLKLTSKTDESYQLTIKHGEESQVNATITAQTFFGARHGIETLFQLLIYDDMSKRFVISKHVYIDDRPVYPYRGILLDTARNYFSVESIKRTLDAMAANKLNTFHWHMTDSQSFPFKSKKYPQFTRYGAYSPRKVYSHEDIRSIVAYARVRGIRVIPELDLPAHVGEGWQWVPGATVCFKAMPWQFFCDEPPCGQLDPTNDRVYDILKHLYAELLEVFDAEIFHMGGHEVNFNCWMSANSIRNWMTRNLFAHSEANLMKLWKRFVDRSYSTITQSNGGRKVSGMIWTSNLTRQGHLNLDKEKYILQIQSKGDDGDIPDLVNRRFRVVFSNYDALHLGCGFGAWASSENKLCSHYIVWQSLYENDPLSLLHEKGVDVEDSEIRKLVLGAEATLFSEQVDEQCLDVGLWPRACALAERLWSRPADSWKNAEYRILEQRERLVRRGIQADLLKPEWCRQNSAHCYDYK